MEHELLRSCCFPGTREWIIQAIIQWVINHSSDSAIVFWLAGPAGSGKSTIANTMCYILDATIVHGGGLRAVVGGSFFCSRQFSETRNSRWIIRTIVYQLALKSKAFKAALEACDRFETIDHHPGSQLVALLIEPWEKSTSARRAGNEPEYTIFIDALDELDREQGVQFLRTLFDVVKQYQPQGLKFLVTSRLDPGLVKEVEAFDNKQVCRLEEVPVEQMSADVELYLRKSLGECASEAQILRLVSDAAGLFIHAATVVEYLKGRHPGKQKSLLAQLIPKSPSGHQPPRDATTKLDGLYTQILETCLVDGRDRDPNIFSDCLSILHTFLCTIERTSASDAVGILNATRDKGEVALDPSDADEVVARLHAVLYVKGGQVMWYHKSFLDFMFDETRSGRFFCNQDEHHRVLAKGCLAVMNKELHFNMAKIPSSHHLDRDNSELATSIDENISTVLRYACRSWSDHLALTPAVKADDLLILLHDLLQFPLLFWIEVMNLLACRGRCQVMLHDAQNWVARAKVCMHPAISDSSRC
jgi:hypothetical protein